MVNVPTRLNDRKTTENDLDVDKIKAVLIDLKKLSIVVEVVKNTKFSKLNTNISNLEKKIPDVPTLIWLKL